MTLDEVVEFEARDYAHGDPIGRLAALIEEANQRGLLVARLRFGQATWAKLRRHPDVARMIVGNDHRPLRAEQLVADYLGIKEIVVDRPGLGMAIE